MDTVTAIQEMQTILIGDLSYIAGLVVALIVAVSFRA